VKSISHAIKSARIHQRLSQKQLAEKMGMNRSNLSRYENGYPMTLGTLQRFSASLEIPMWRIVRYAEKLQRQMESTEEAQA
jgi:transcriptional regulator with XRE-family HTH domain